jgi:hypothetical protein
MRYIVYDFGIARVTPAFFDTYSPANGCTLCAPRAIFCSKPLIDHEC